MKKSIQKIIVLCLLPVLAFAFLLAGCGNGDNNENTQKYTVTVINGTGGGEFESGASCTVTATVPSGQIFVEWTADGATVSTQNPYTFTVMANITLTAVCRDTGGTAVTEGTPVSLEKSVGGNPIGGFGVGDNSYDQSWDTDDELWQIGDKEGVLTYGGDPSVLVVEENGAETAYLYVGHDVSQGGDYQMPEWVCYSSTDLLTWTAESIIMDINDVPWARKLSDGTTELSAWAAQVIEYKGYYWFLFCSWSNQTGVTADESGSQCIGVAVAKDPAGPFTCFSEPLVYSTWTNNADDSSITVDKIPGWNDIDPTGLVTDANEDGAEEFYISWGNSNSFLAQVEMVEVSASDTYRAAGFDVALEIVDQSATTDSENPAVIDRTSADPVYGGDTEKADSSNAADWDIMRLNCYSNNPIGNTFTEAPYLYERDGMYYIFYACGWREALAYSVSDTLWEVTWDYGNLLMDATATSNTNHPAVFDFGGSTYMIYHNGSLPYGSGYRRVACIAELEFDTDGYIEYVVETSTGLTGVTSKIADSNGTPISHINYKNPQLDPSSSLLYPLELDMLLWAETDLDDLDDMLWELEEAKYVPNGENGAHYVSIQSYNKAGLYICYDVASGKVILTQDSEDPASDAGKADKINMTFKTLVGENGEGVQFQCAADPDFYLASVNGRLVVTDGATIAQRTFRVQTETANRSGVYERNEGQVLASV